MDVGQFLGMVVGAYFFVLGAFAAWTVMRALSDGDGARLAGRVYLTLTKTTFFVGFPALLGALLLLNAKVEESCARHVRLVDGARAGEAKRGRRLHLFVCLFVCLFV